MEWECDRKNERKNTWVQLHTKINHMESEPSEARFERQYGYEVKGA